VSEDDLIAAVSHAFKAGWSNVKLYFMLGLPTEEDDDLRGIAAMARRVVQAYRRKEAVAGPRLPCLLLFSYLSPIPLSSGLAK
jgi:radical SAM superfamily enzyme YgiQ (UPF0313 family)